MLSPTPHAGADRRSWAGPRALLLPLALAASLAAAPAPPPAGPPAAPVADAKVDADALLQRLSEEAERIDPSTPDALPRLRSVVRGLIDVERASRREIAALRAELATLRGELTTLRAAASRPAANASQRRPAASTQTLTTMTAGTAKPNAPAAASLTSSGPLFGKRGLKKAHRPGCSFGERIRAEDRVTFPTMTEAAAAGYDACKVCKPD